jgi:hypothetical protein
VNPEYYIINPDDVAEGPYSTAEEARQNIDDYQLKRYAGGVRIARVIAESSTQATYTVSWARPNPPIDGSNFIASPTTLGE